MSRTPSMTLPELESLLGPRGNLIVTTENRATARKWLTAQGLPSLFVGGLAMRAIAAAYNETDGKALARLQAQAADANADAEDDFPALPTPSTLPAILTPSPGILPALPASHETPVNTDATIAAVQALRLLLGDNKGGLDADAVRAIIRKELPNLIPVTRLEIKTPDGVVKDHGAKPRHKQFAELLQVMSAGCHAVLVGPAGSGKTLAVEQACEALGKEFRIQGAIQGAHELLGYVDGNGLYHSTAFRDSFQNGAAMCLDEIDGGDPAGQLVANSALANCYMPFPDSTKPIARHQDFLAIACANTYGNGADRLYVGRNQLDAAFLDRFVFIPWHYDETLERAIAGNDDWVTRVQALRRGVEKERQRMVISLRASINGAKLLAAGLSRSRVEELCIWKGTDAESRRRIETAAA